LFVREDQSLPAIATTRTLSLVAWMVIVGLFSISAWATDTSARLHAIESGFEITTTSQHDVIGCSVHAAKPGHPCCGIACCPIFAVLSPPAYQRSGPRLTPTPCPATLYASLAPEVLPPPPKGRSQPFSVRSASEIGSRQSSLESKMNSLIRSAAGMAATLAFLGTAIAQETAAQAPMPEACTAGSARMEGHDMGAMAAPDANLSEHQAAMMQGMIATTDQMMQGLMAKDPDVAFACGMIPHHQAAINMAKAELEYGDDSEMREMAQMIIDAQSKEIEQLTSWIEKNSQ
jgi:hypothetical protein